MANGSIKTTLGKNIQLYRSYTVNGDLSATQYLAPTKVRIGTDGVTPNIANTNLTKPLPISDGTVNDDGSNTLTGSLGGDNSTSNTVTFKEGAGLTDVTAQNLIANGTSISKIWTIADLTVAGANCVSTQYVGLWLYILDATALAKFLTAGTALEIRLGVDSTTNYYSKVLTASELAVGWNWISDNGLLSAWTVNGTPGTLNDFQIRITTNLAADAFIAGDVVYDLLRQWTYAESLSAFTVGWPTFDYINNEVLIKSRITSIQANGYLVDNLSLWNEDTAPLMASEDKQTGESKSSTDEFILIFKERIL